MYHILQLSYFKKRSFIFFLFSIFCFTTVAQKSSFKKINFYKDTVQMKNEILKHIPIGTRVEKAISLMRRNKIEYEIKKNGEVYYGENELIIDYINCKYKKVNELQCIDYWNFIFLYEKEKITNVLVAYLYDCPLK